MNIQENIEKLKQAAKSKILESKEQLEVDWDTMSKETILPEYVIEEFIESMNWDLICTNQILSENFIRKFKREVNWSMVTKIQRMSEAFMQEMEGFIDWDALLYSKDLSVEFLNKNKARFELWLTNWFEVANTKGTLNSHSNWFDGSAEGALQKNVLLNNIIKLGELGLTEEAMNKMSEEDVACLCEELGLVMEA